MADPDWLRDDILDKNSKYKKFHNEITSCLQRFEKTQDWADLIEKITRLQAALNDYSQFKVIPERVQLSRTLARCLNPNLVIGIHRKAIETLELIFKRLGPEQLAKDLPLFSVGLFTLFPHAAIATKPEIMRLYETYFLPLGPAALEACLAGLMSSVLPAVHKEENGDMYRRAVAFLNNLLTMMTQQGRSRVFYHTLWTSIWKSPSLRTPAFNYIKERLPRSKPSMERRPSDVTEDMVGGDVQLISVALQASLADPCESTQRGALDCLTTNFLIHEDGVFSNSDFVALMSACLVLLTHNQLSTLRRVFIWIYGGDEVNAEYFEKHSKQIITYALSDLLEGIGPCTRQQGFEILLTLLHRPKGEGHFIRVVPELAPKIMAAVVAMAPTMKVARIFDVVPLHHFFSGFKNVVVSFQKNVHVVEHSQLQLLLSFLELVNGSGDASKYLAADIELYTECVRELSVFLKFLAMECRSMDSLQFLQYAGKGIEMLCIIYGILRTLLAKEKISAQTETITTDFKQYVEALLENFYMQELSTEYLAKDTQPFGVCPPALVPLPICNHGAEEIKLLMTSLNVLISLSQHSDQQQDRSPRAYSEDLSSYIPKWLLQLLGIITQTECNLAVHAVELFLDVVFPDGPYAVLDTSLRNHLLFETVCCRYVVQRLWGFFDLENQVYHWYIAKQLCRFFSQGGVNDVTGSTSFFGRLLTNVICNDMSLNESRGCSRFAFLWNVTKDTKINDPNRVLSSALLLMLDNLRSDSSNSRLIGSSWLNTAVTHLHRVLDALVELVPDATSSLGVERKRAEYVVNTLLSIVDTSPEVILRAAFDIKPTTCALEVLNGLMAKSSSTTTDGIIPAGLVNQHYFAVLIAIAFRLVQIENDVCQAESVLATRCMHLINTLISKASAHATNYTPALAHVSFALFDPCLTLLAASISRKYPVLQSELLNTIQVVLSHLEKCYTAKSWNLVDSSIGSTSTEYCDYVLTASSQPKLIKIIVEGLTVASSLEGMLELSCYNFLSMWRNAATSVLGYSHANITTNAKELVQTYLSLLDDLRRRWPDAPSFITIFENSCKGIRQVGEYLFSERTAQLPEYMQQTVITNAAVPLLMAPTTRVVSTPLQTAQLVWLSELQPKIIRSMLDWHGIVNKSVAGFKKAIVHKVEEVHVVALQGMKGTVENSMRSLFDLCLLQSPSKFIGAIINVWTGRRSFGIELFGEDEQDRNVIEIMNTLQGMSPDLVVDRVIETLSAVRSERKVSKKRLTAAEYLQEITPIHFLNTYVEHCKPAERLSECFDKLLTSMCETAEKAKESQLHPFTLLMILRTTEVAAWRSTALKSTAEDKRVKRIATDLLSNVLLNVCKETEPLSLQDVSSSEHATDTYATVLVTLEDVMLKCAESGFFFRETERVCLLVSNLFQVPLNSVLKMKSEQDNAVQTIMMRVRNAGRIRAACSVLCTLLVKLPVQVIKRVGKDVFDSLQDSNFFKLDRPTLSKWREIFGAILSTEPAFLESTLTNMKPPDYSFLVMEKQRKTDAISRARMLKRLAFVIFCSNVKDNALLNTILQRITESVKYYNMILDGIVLRYALFVFRVLMTRAPRTAIAAFWPIIIGELIRIFSTFDGRSASKDLVLEALKVIDFACNVVPEEFAPFRWMFFDISSHVVPGTPAGATYSPLLPALASKYTNATSQAMNPIMELGYDEPTTDMQRSLHRPAISFPERCYDTVSDVGVFLTQLLRQHESVDVTCISEPSRYDQAYVDWLLLGEFIQKGVPVDESSVRVPDAIMDPCEETTGGRMLLDPMQGIVGVGTQSRSSAMSDPPTTIVDEETPSGDHA